MLQRHLFFFILLSSSHLGWLKMFKYVYQWSLAKNKQDSLLRQSSVQCWIECGTWENLFKCLFFKEYFILGENVYPFMTQIGHAFFHLQAFVYAVITIRKNTFLPYSFIRLTSTCLLYLSLEVIISEKLSLTLAKQAKCCMYSSLHLSFIHLFKNIC